MKTHTTQTKMNNSRQYFSSEYKTSVVKYYIKNKKNQSFGDVARHFNLKCGRRIVRAWYNQYLFNNNKIKSAPTKGRHPLLDCSQQYELIQRKVKKKNQLHHPITSRILKNEATRATNTKISLRTIQRYIKHYKIKNKKTINRTPYECNLPLFNLKLI
jgi:transposase